MNYQYKYYKYKTKYLDLKNNLRTTFVNLNSSTNYSNMQTGGGAWSAFSSGNDSTQDIISMYKFIEWHDDKPTYHKDLKSTNIALKKLFRDFGVDIKKKDPKTKNPDTSIYNLNYAYLGVITDLLVRFFAISKEYLVRALIHAYKDYIKVYITKESSGWKSYEDRLSSLRYEILLINYAINRGTPIKIPKQFVTTDEYDSHVSDHKLVEFIDELIMKNHKDIIDYIFLRHKKIKPKYSFMKYEYEPLLDPTILNIGTVMQGYDGRGYSTYYIIAEKNGKRYWKYYDPFEDVATIYLQIDMLYDIYDDVITKLNRKDLRTI